MAYSAITKPTDYQNSIIINGNGSTQALTGVGHQPDWIWMKRSNAIGHHRLIDTVRGISKIINTDLTNSEATTPSYVTAIGTDGWTVGNNTDVNPSGGVTMGWSWKAGGSASSNGDGSITSTVSANQTAGFSIVTTTGTGSAGTIGHGIGIAPKMIIGKRRDSTGSQWRVFNSNLSSASHILFLDTTDAEQSGNSATWNNTAPTSTVFSVGASGDVNASSGTFVYYCFAEVKGYSKFGSYTGNGNADGTFVYTGFKPGWLMIKRTDATNSWFIGDNKRDIDNQVEKELLANTADAESTSGTLDFLSNGFKLTSTRTRVNTSGGTYIYMAFAENPFVANDSGTAVPVTAR